MPPGTPASAVFDEMGQALLVLGAPGSGKTTWLLNLTRDLLDRAELDTEQPIPVVFNLASWAAQRSPVTDWLVNELAEAYDVPRKIGQCWVDAEQILPLLDGLDEVAVEHRKACVEAINAFREDHGFVPMVVCSRTAEHAALTIRLRLVGAVEIQPLTELQVNAYLKEVGEPFAGLRVALHDDPALQALLETPLMLSIVTIAYQGKSASEILRTGTLEKRRQQLFAAYVDTMFERRKHNVRYPKHKAVYWLAWLARSLQRHNQVEFYLERMQRDWLPTRYQQYVLTFLSGLGVGLIAALVTGLFILGLLFQFVYDPGFDPGLNPGLRLSNMEILGLIGLSALLFLVLVAALVSAMFYGLGELSGATHVALRLRWSWLAVREKLGLALLAGLSLGGLVFGFVTLLDREPFLTPVSKLMIGVFYGLVSILIAGLVNGLSPRIPLTEGLRGSRWIAVFAGLGYGLLAGLLVSLFADLNNSLFFGVLFGAFGVLIFGLGEYSGALQLRAGQGWSWSAVLTRLASTLLISLVTILFAMATLGLPIALYSGELSGALTYALVFGLLYGFAAGLFYVFFTGRPTALRMGSVESARRSVGASILTGLLIGLLVWLIFGLILGIAFEKYYVGKRLPFGLMQGLFLGVFVGLMSGLSWRLGERSMPIQPAEQLHWSWVTLRDRLRPTLVVGFLVGLVNGCSGMTSGKGVRQGLLDGFALGLVVLLSSGLLSGFSVSQLSRPRTIPNEGLRRSVQSAGIVGSTTCLLVGLLIFLPNLLFSGMRFPPSQALVQAMAFGVSAGIIASVFFGGMACCQHCLLRLLLIYNRNIPRHYVEFLDYSVERIFLRKIGGGYIFVHKLILEYFAELELEYS